jgi:hypothetical protein
MCAIEGVRCAHVIGSRLNLKNPTIARSPEQAGKIETFLSIAPDCKEQQAEKLVRFVEYFRIDLMKASLFRLLENIAGIQSCV